MQMRKPTLTQVAFPAANDRDSRFRYGLNDKGQHPVMYELYD
jgi:hypothetical protein